MAAMAMLAGGCRTAGPYERHFRPAAVPVAATAVVSPDGTTNAPAVAAVPYTLFIPAGRVALVIIAVGQLVGGASWCVPVTGRAKTGLKLALAIVGYAAVLAAVCVYALGLA